MERDETDKLWKRLAAGKSLRSLALPVTDEGRIDLRRIAAPEFAVTSRKTPFGRVDEKRGLLVIRNATWDGIDFSNARLDSLRFFDCRIQNCKFDSARCRDWRMWGTTISETSFFSADLQEAVLGGVKDGVRNSFQHVDFSHADLRGTTHVSSDMVDCNFEQTRLRKVDFQGTVFVRCTFSGELEEVLFYRTAFRGEHLPPNEMAEVDFRKAKFRFVEFRGLDMLSVIWPEDDDHIVLDDYKDKLDRAIDRLKGRLDLPSKELDAILSMKRKWAGPNQRQGVISKADLIEAGGPNAPDEFRLLVQD